jgi:non-ribosomal peptide synthetase component F
LRADITGEEGFRQLLSKTRSTTLDALAHADVPFEKLVETLEPERQVNRNPLFQVMFVFQNIPKQQLELSGLVLQEVEFESGIAKFDLTLEILKFEGLRCKFEFDADLFDRTTIERMAGHFEILLEGILADPDQEVWKLPLLTEPELQQLSVLNSTQSEYPKDSSIHAYFEQRAELMPNAIALVCEGEEIRYSRLNQLANRLAHGLIREGVRPGDLVGISLKRSIAMVAGLLGILKTGAAYVPLDPSYPEERLAFMLRDSQVQRIVTSSDVSEVFRNSSGNIALMEVEGNANEGADCSNPSQHLHAEARAYVIYTSGSTGTPKGVEGTHQASINRMAWMWQAYPFQAGEVCCQKTALGFVDSVWEIFGPLLAGIRSVILPEEAGLDITYLVQMLGEHKVSRIVLVPSLLRVLLEQG